MIDLRSDTVTIPTAEMREAMAQAPVGDDVYGEDPTVNALEERVAEILGKDAAIYMSSGTMTNQVAIRTHTEPGDEILIDKNAHIYFYEAACGVKEAHDDTGKAHLHFAVHFLLRNTSILIADVTFAGASGILKMA